MRPDPVGRLLQAVCEQGDIKTVFPRVNINFLFLGREQVEQQCRLPRLLQLLGGLAVANTVPTATAAVNEQHDALKARRRGQIAVQPRSSAGNADFMLCKDLRRWVHAMILQAPALTAY